MKWVFLGLALLWAGEAVAQPKQVVGTCGGATVAQIGDTINGTANPVGQDCVNASVSVSASITGFTPGGTYASLTATNTSASVALPLGVTVQFQNAGTTTVSCTLGVGSATALANELIVQPGSTKTVVVGSNTFGACIDQTGSTSNVVVLAGGSGLGNDSGGGSSSGSGGAVTIADGANITQGAIADTAWSGSGSSTVVAALKAIYTKLVGSIAVTGTFWQATQPVSMAAVATGGSTSANQTSQITQETATANALGTTADAVCGTATGTCTLPALIKFLNNAATSAIPTGTNLIGNTGTLYPAGSTPITASATGTTAATTATLAGTASKSTYLCGFSIRANATAAATANSTVTGTITGTLNFTQWTAPNASGIGLTEQIFSPCVIASAANTGIAVISAAPGTGGVVSVSAWGFQL